MKSDIAPDYMASGKPNCTGLLVLGIATAVIAAIGGVCPALFGTVPAAYLRVVALPVALIACVCFRLRAFAANPGFRLKWFQVICFTTSISVLSQVYLIGAKTQAVKELLSLTPFLIFRRVCFLSCYWCR